MAQDPSWAEELEVARRELRQLAERERRLLSGQLEGILRRLERVETAVAELTSESPNRRSADAPPPIQVPHEPQLRPGRFARPDGPAQHNGKDGAVPAGALAMARRLADEGHSREEVSAFLDENFRRIDVPAAVAEAFGSAQVN
jgi:hypothetical protein